MSSNKRPPEGSDQVYMLVERCCRTVLASKLFLVCASPTLLLETASEAVSQAPPGLRHYAVVSFPRNSKVQQQSVRGNCRPGCPWPSIHQHRGADEAESQDRCHTDGDMPRAFHKCHVSERTQQRVFRLDRHAVRASVLL